MTSMKRKYCTIEMCSLTKSSKKTGKNLSDSSDDDYKLVIDISSESEIELESEDEARAVKFRVSH